MFEAGFLRNRTQRQVGVAQKLLSLAKLHADDLFVNASPQDRPGDHPCGGEIGPYLDERPATSPPPPAGMHIGGLAGTWNVVKQGSTASLTVTAHDTSHAVLAGVTVSVSWSGAASGSGTCTNRSGMVAVQPIEEALL